MPFVWPLIQDILANPPLTVERDSRTVHPSNMGLTLDMDGRAQRFGGCIRSEFYRLSRYPGNFSPADYDQEFKTGVGNFNSTLLDRIFKQGWVYLGAEVPITIVRKTARGTGYRISGRIDHVIKDQKTNRPIFIELKTPGDFKADGNCKPKKGAKIGENVYLTDIPYLPDLEYIIQVVPYLWWVKEELGVEDPEFNIMIVTRGRVEKGEHIVRFHHDGSIIVENAEGVTHLPQITVAKVFEDTDRLADAVRFGEVPDRPYELAWSRETILSLYQAKRLSKTDHERIQRILAKDPDGEIVLTDNQKQPRGDWRCNPKYCPFTRGCYGNEPWFVPGGTMSGPVSTIRGEVVAPGADAHIPEEPA